MKTEKAQFRILFLAMLAAISFPVSVVAQTNTFPSSGDVGIGTTSPSYLLDVAGNTHFSAGNVISWWDDGNGTGNIQKQANNFVIAVDGNRSLDLATNGSYRFAIDGSGNVGIGTTTPLQQMSISSGASARTELLMSDGNTASLMLAAGNSTDGVVASDVGLQFRTGVSYPTADSGGTTAMTILANGYVGIGTANPGEPLEVSTNVSKATAANTSVMSLSSSDSSNPLQLVAQINGNTTAADSYTSLTSVEQGVSYRNFVLQANGGNVGIGTTDPAYPLSVNGTVEAKEVIVQTGWSDYVFDPHYHLPALGEVERTITDQKHLPGMPSSKEVAEHGIKVGEMDAKLLAQIEELTLRQIDQEKLQMAQEKRMDEQDRRIEQLEKENTELKAGN